VCVCVCICFGVGLVWVLAGLVWVWQRELRLTIFLKYPFNKWFGFPSHVSVGRLCVCVCVCVCLCACVLLLVWFRCWLAWFGFGKRSCS